MHVEPTGKEEKHEPVHEQHRPENWHVEDLPPTAEEADGDGPRGPVPELEFGKAADKGLEFVIGARGKGARGAILHVVVGLFGGVEFGGQEGEEEVEEVDAEGVCD